MIGIGQVMHPILNNIDNDSDLMQRFAEMRAMTAERTKTERLKQEQKQAARDMERLKKQ